LDEKNIFKYQTLQAPLLIKQNQNILKFILGVSPAFLRFSDNSLRKDPKIIKILTDSPKLTYKAYKYLLEPERIKTGELFIKTHPKCFKHLPDSSKTKELIISMYETSFELDCIITSKRIYQKFIYFYDIQCRKIGKLLENKIFMMYSNKFIPLDLIEFKEEEAEILSNIFMTLRRMYVELSFRNSKKGCKWNNIQFNFK
jgi:hypothetical protein